MPGLSSELHNQLRNTLLKCSEFESDTALRAILVTEELHPFRNRLPDTTGNSKGERVDAYLAFLLDQLTGDGRPVLPLFLVALRDRCDPDDALHTSLKRLAEDVAEAWMPPALLTHSQTQPEIECESTDIVSDRQPTLSQRVQVTKITKHLQIHRRIEDAAVLAGGNNLVGSLVGRMLYRRLEEVLTKLQEPGVLIIDCSNINLADSSRLLITVAKLLAFSRANSWRKAIAFSNTSDAFRSALATAIIAWPDILSLEAQRCNNRLVALASDRVDEHMWHLLGEITDEERGLWHIVKDAGWISIKKLVLMCGQEEDLVLSNLEAFVGNRLVWKIEHEGETGLCSLQYLL